jgi:hypothetical protein
VREWRGVLRTDGLAARATERAPLERTESEAAELLTRTTLCSPPIHGSRGLGRAIAAPP